MCKPIKDHLAIMKNSILTYVLLLLSVTGFAQQQTQSSFNYLNGFNINKSYAGKDACSQVFIQHKSQWVGVDNAPTNLFLQAHTQLPKKFGVGLTVNNWSAGLLTEFDAAVAVAKHFQLSRDVILSPSINLGYSRFGFKANDVVAFDSDSYLNQSNTSENSFYADLGMLATYKELEVGVSLPKLINTDLTFDVNNVDPTYDVESYFKAHASYDYTVNEDWGVKPMLVYRSIPSNGSMLDVLAAVSYQNTFGLGLGYRTNSGLLASASFQLKDMITIGYAYDAGMQQLAGISSGSHEVLLGVKFCKTSDKANEPEVLQYYLNGKVTDASNGQPLVNSEVTLNDGLSGEVIPVTLDSNGSYRTEIAPGRAYTIEVSNPDFESYKDNFTSDSTLENNVKNVELTHKSVSITGKVTTIESNEPLEGVTVLLSNSNSSKTNKAGEFKSVASKQTTEVELQKQATLTKNGYHDTTVTYTILPGDYNTINIKGSMRKIIDDQPAVVDNKVEVNPIYFEVGSATISESSYKELDQIVSLMQANPEMKIEVNAHTDCTGSAVSNQALSDKRAKACAEYIASKISNPNRINGKGYGESKPLSDCNCADCSEADHAKNRRTEFVILSNK